MTMALARPAARPSTAERAARGRLIINADDWGRDATTTRSILDCVRLGTVTAVSAMVFMEDSERGAALALEHGIDAGLHLNFTDTFTAPGCPPAVVERQRRIVAYLRRHRLAQLVFNPGLMRAFEYVVAAQIEEYRRLFGAAPARLDGHHHMHLCANVLLQELLPANTRVRRNFSFQRGEKSALNRAYRRFVDDRLARRHSLTDYLFSLPPFEPADRLQRICSLARTHIVELETHPVNPDEYRFLTGGAIRQWIGDLSLGPARRSAADGAAGASTAGTRSGELL